jgi:hypothetical protein
LHPWTNHLSTTTIEALVRACVLGAPLPPAHTHTHTHTQTNTHTQTPTNPHTQTPTNTHTHTHTHTNKHTHTNTHKHTHTNTHKHTHTHTPARPPCNIRWHARTIARCRCTPASASQLSACAVFSPFFLRTPCIRGPTCGTRQKDWNILHVLHVLSQGRRIFSVPGIDQEPDGENRVDATWHSVSRRPQGAILSATMNDNMLFAFCFCDSTFQCWARSQASRERGSIPLAVACCCCLF